MIAFGTTCLLLALAYLVVMASKVFDKGGEQGVGQSQSRKALTADGPFLGRESNKVAFHKVTLPNPAEPSALPGRAVGYCFPAITNSVKNFSNCWGS